MVTGIAVMGVEGVVTGARGVAPSRVNIAVSTGVSAVGMRAAAGRAVMGLMEATGKGNRAGRARTIPSSIRGVNRLNR